MDREKIIDNLGWIYSALTKGVIIENDDAVIKAILEAIALLKDDELYIQHQKDGYAELEAEYNKLLKDQEERIRTLKGNVDYYFEMCKNRVPVVRCKDCVHGEHCLNGAGEEAVECHNDYSFGDVPICHMPEFYCYDGVKRDELQ